MTYEPPIGDATKLSFEGVYIPRHGGNVILGGTGYIARWGGDLYLVSEGEYKPPSGALVNLEFGESVVIPEVPDPPTIEDGLPKMRPDIAILWGQGEAKEKGYRLQHKDAAVLITHKTIKWVKEKDSNDRDVIIPWGSLTENDKRLRLKYSRFVDILDLCVDLPTGTPGTKDEARRLQYGQPDIKDDEQKIPFRSPPKKDDSNRLLFADFEVTPDAKKEMPFNQGIISDGHHNTRWGKKFYEEICTRDYKTPGGSGLDFNLETPIADVDDGLLIRFRFDSLSYDLRCKHDEPTGFRDAYSFRPPVIYPYPRTPIKDLWIIMNSVSLTRVSDNKPLAVTDISVTSDLGSWCWGFDATINNLDSYLAICPDGTTNTVVKAEMNGRNWLARIERASETVAFGKPAWRVSGRSLSSELAAPAAAAASYLESSDRTAVQLMEAALENSGWTLVMESVDWLVSGGSLSVESETPLQVVQRIAASVGAVVQSDRELKTLRVVPRYKGNPWSWAGATPDLSIDESVVRSFSPEWVPGVQYNGVYVSGTNQGVLARVIRSGTAGDVLAPMVTDALCTATEVAMERGRNVLAKSGPWQNISIDLPMMPGSDLPGLLIPGSLIEVTQGTRGTWRAQVVSTRIRGTWNNGCSVRQLLSVERYFGS